MCGTSRFGATPPPAAAAPIMQPQQTQPKPQPPMQPQLPMQPQPVQPAQAKAVEAMAVEAMAHDWVKDLESQVGSSTAPIQPEQAQAAASSLLDDVDAEMANIEAMLNGVHPPHASPYPVPCIHHLVCHGAVLDCSPPCSPTSQMADEPSSSAALLGGGANAGADGGGSQAARPRVLSSGGDAAVDL